jgi:hypothetical protein
LLTCKPSNPKNPASNGPTNIAETKSDRIVVMLNTTIRHPGFSCPASV